MAELMVAVGHHPLVGAVALVGGPVLVLAAGAVVFRLLRRAGW